MPRSIATDEASAHSQPEAAQVRAELARVLASSAFAASRRCQQFLVYVCEKSLNGEEQGLKERTIAVDVFGRNLHADLGEDTIVRVGAREVRKRLQQFYSSPESADSVIRISLPSGSYVPEFVSSHQAVTVVAAEPSVPAVESIPVPARRVGAGWYVAGIVAAIAVTAAVLTLTRPVRSAESHRGFQQFWEPVFSSSDPLLVAVGHPLVYHPSPRAIQLSEGRLPAPAVPSLRPLQVKPEELNGSDLVPVENHYVGFGDMVVSTEVATMLARHSRATRVRLASSVPFADLRQSRSLLIGSVSNQWTMQLQREWRFRFARMPDMSYAIEDSQQKPAVQYRNKLGDDGSIADDYLVLSRIMRSSAGGMQIVACGIKQFGTEAAGRLLTDPAQLSGILSRLPSGWEKKNVQLLMHVRVIGNTPDEPELVAAHVW